MGGISFLLATDDSVSFGPGAVTLTTNLLGLVPEPPSYALLGIAMSLCLVVHRLSKSWSSRRSIGEQ
jgi:hypothetical protein